MKYIFFVSRESWPAFNSIYAYIVLKKSIPDRFLALYTDSENMRAVEHMLSIIYESMDRELKLEKIKIATDSPDNIKEILENSVHPGDVVDITGARKIMILSLMSLQNIKVCYLLLKDMTFAGVPFMMRPLSTQSLVEVEI